MALFNLEIPDFQIFFYNKTSYNDTCYEAPVEFTPMTETHQKNNISKAKYRQLLDVYKKKKNKQRLEKLIAFIEEHLSSDINMKDLSRSLGMSYTALYRLIKSTTHQTPSLFVRSYRLKKALYLIESTTLNISEIAYDVGFKDPNYFSRTFKEAFGVAPSMIRR